jgi:hypothetical protein
MADGYGSWFMVTGLMVASIDHQAVAISHQPLAILSAGSE